MVREAFGFVGRQGKPKIEFSLIKQHASNLFPRHSRLIDGERTTASASITDFSHVPRQLAGLLKNQRIMFAVVD